MKVAAHHVESLDVFRGAMIAAMILVNNPGDWGAVFPPLMHAYWIGSTFADFVFPSFIFIVGVTMPVAFARRREHGHDTQDLYARIVRRVVLLIVLGLVLNAVSAWPNVLPLRIPGVLQRIALAYLISAPVVLHLEVRGWLIAIAVLLGGHWALLALMPFDGYPGGTLTPEHNLARYVDTMVFGRHALTTRIEPEGLLGALPSAATALIGALAGQWIHCAATKTSGLGTLVIGGTLALALGLAWSHVLPVSKPLWTGSFVLIVTGFAMLMFALTYFLVDVRGVRSYARPFLWLGVNPLAIYCFSDVVGHLLEKPWIHEGATRTTPKGWLFWNYLEPAFRPWPAEWASVAFGVAIVILWMAVAGVLYQRRVRIQV